MGAKKSRKTQAGKEGKHTRTRTRTRKITSTKGSHTGSKQTPHMMNLPHGAAAHHNVTRRIPACSEITQDGLHQFRPANYPIDPFQKHPVCTPSQARRFPCALALVYCSKPWRHRGHQACSLVVSVYVADRPKRRGWCNRVTFSRYTSTCWRASFCRLTYLYRVPHVPPMDCNEAFPACFLHTNRCFLIVPQS